MEDQVNQLTTSFTLLQQSNDRALTDVLNLQDLIAKERGEMTNLKSQLAQVTQDLVLTRAKYEEGLVGKEHDAQTIRQLSQAVTMMGSQKSLANLSPAPTTTPIIVQEAVSRSVEPVMDSTIVPVSTMRNYKSATDGLLSSIRGPVPSNVLMSMKGVLVSCKAISDGVGDWERVQPDVNATHSLLQAPRDGLSTSLTGLMAGAKNHASSFGKVPGVEVLEGLVDKLTESVNKLVKMDGVQVLETQMSGVNLGPGTMPADTASLPLQTFVAPQSVYEASQFVQPPSQATEVPLEPLPSVVVEAASFHALQEPPVQVLAPPPPTEIIQETTPMSRSPRLSPRVSPLPMDNEPNPRRQSWAGAPPISPGLVAIQPAMGTSPSPIVNAVPLQTRSINPSPLPVDASPVPFDASPVNALPTTAAMPVPELKGYLETQTDQIVKAIQALLFAMRQSTTYGQEFKETIHGITSIVDDITSKSRATFSLPSAVGLKVQGEDVVAKLEASNRRLEELDDEMVDQPQSKTVKQKLASSSYEVARYVKDLISLI